MDFQIAIGVRSPLPAKMLTMDNRANVKVTLGCFEEDSLVGALVGGYINPNFNSFESDILTMIFSDVITDDELVIPVNDIL